MNELDVNEYARQLQERYGPNSVLVAAQKASALERTGEKDEAFDWRKIEHALKVTQGPHQS